MKKRKKLFLHDIDDVIQPIPFGNVIYNNPLLFGSILSFFSFFYFAKKKFVYKHLVGSFKVSFNYLVVWKVLKAFKYHFHLIY